MSYISHRSRVEKIGYVHVRVMDGESFQTVYDRILGKYRNWDAIVVDNIADNGGG